MNCVKLATVIVIFGTDCSKRYLHILNATEMANIYSTRKGQSLFIIHFFAHYQHTFQITPSFLRVWIDQRDVQQCDQMAKLFVQFLAFYKKEHLLHISPEQVQNLPNTK